MSNKKILGDLKKTILEFITDLKDNIFTRDEEKTDLQLVEFFFNKMDAETVMQKAILFILPWKSYIKERNADFFIKNKDIFQGLPPDKIEYFSSLWKKGDKRLSEENRGVIWDYFDTILTLIENHEKKK